MPDRDIYQCLDLADAIFDALCFISVDDLHYVKKQFALFDAGHDAIVEARERLDEIVMDRAGKENKEVADA